jgi:hypothetical protein
MGRRRFTLICALLGVLLLPAAASAARKPSIQKTLDALAAQGAITPEQHTAYTRDYSRSRSAVRHLRGSARTNLQGVLDNTAYLAGQGTLGARVVPVFLTLERNYEWFWIDREGPAHLRRHAADLRVLPRVRLADHGAGQLRQAQRSRRSQAHQAVRAHGLRQRAAAAGR